MVACLQLQMQSIIAARGLNALQKGSQTSTGIMRLAQQDNKMMLKFSEKAQRDARVLRTITILTVVYLPVSFVAVSYRASWLAHIRQNLISLCSKF